MSGCDGSTREQASQRALAFHLRPCSSPDLASIGIGSRVAHGEQAALVMLQLERALVVLHTWNSSKPQQRQ